MQHLDFNALTAAFGSHNRAFHLEVRDDYSMVPGEGEALQRFLAGQPPITAEWEPWFDLMRDVTSNGTQVQRVRVITEPHTDYIRFALSITPANIAAGEDIRWLPRNLAGDIAGDDWWLFDDDLVAYTVFTADSTIPGWAATTDPAVVAHCGAVRDRLWRAAIPHGDYVR